MHERKERFGLKAVEWNREAVKCSAANCQSEYVSTCPQLLRFKIFTLT